MEQTQAGKVPSNVQEIQGRGETLQAARERLNETLAGVSERARHAMEYADETVHNNPWTSIGVGFGVGIVIGALITLAASSRSTRLL
jgi:ElaB/YqjD/DUF883 family membrane-anchored ribosome-binding protein